jgi:hypothetical protein
MKYYDLSISKEFAALEQRSNKLLDQLPKPSRFDPNDETTAAEIALIGGKLTYEGFAEVGGIEQAEELHDEGIARDEYDRYSIASKQPVRYRPREDIAAAIDKGDHGEAERIAGSDAELWRFLHNYKRRPGKQKHRPQDHSDVRRAALEDLWNESNLLRQLWEQHDIKLITKETKYKGPERVAIAIVARRAARPFKDDAEKLEKQLISWGKNRRRSIS